MKLILELEFGHPVPFKRDSTKEEQIDLLQRSIVAEINDLIFRKQCALDGTNPFGRLGDLKLINFQP